MSSVVGVQQREGLLFLIRGFLACPLPLPPPPPLSPFPCVVKVCFGKEKVITFQTPFLLSRGSREEGGERSNLSFFIIFSCL